jgi:hypothetical protein
MDRTAGHEGWSVVRPFPTFASNCIVPTFLYNDDGNVFGVGGVNGGNATGACESAYILGVDPVTQLPYVPNPTVGNGTFFKFTDYPGWDPSTAPNNGEGFFKELGGNQLPNAPHWTGTVTGDYTVPLPSEWLMTLHTDVHWQSQSWWRVFNDHVYDKLHPYFTMNLAAIFSNEERGWNIMAYIKNVTDETAITGAFLNSDDTGLTTNVFLTEPRLYGLRVTKAWSDGSLLGNFGARREGPYPFVVEIGGQVQRHDAPNEIYRPDFLDSFAAPLDPSGKQREDLDWGDGREIKLSYAPAGGWRVSLGARFGETNRGERVLLEGEAVLACAGVCEYGGAHPLTDYGATHLAAKEEHTIVDFHVGHDVGLGSVEGSQSTILAGIRYADFKSNLSGSLYGTPDWQPPSGDFLFNPATHHHYEASIQAERSFKGAGPVISWEASANLFDYDASGRVDLDWGLSGGVLFGKQKAAVNGEETGAYYSQKYGDWPKPPESETSTPLNPPSRSKSVTVPVLGAGLGLSYKIDRVNVGAGYRWERYFNAIDGGITEHKSYDRTIDGPYFKIAVGFGG